MHIFLPDEHYCEHVHSGVCEQCALTVELRSRQCQISIEPSRQKTAKTLRELALICSRKIPNLAVVYKKDAGREVCATRFTFDQKET